MKKQVPQPLTSNDNKAMCEFALLIKDFIKSEDQLAVLYKIFLKHKEGNEKDLLDGMKALYPEVSSADNQYDILRKHLERAIATLERLYDSEKSKDFKYRFSFLSTEKKVRQSDPRDLTVYYELNKNYKDYTREPNSKVPTREKKLKQEDLLIKTEDLLIKTIEPIRDEVMDLKRVVLEQASTAGSIILKPHKHGRIGYHPQLLKWTSPFYLPATGIIVLLCFAFTVYGKLPGWGMVVCIGVMLCAAYYLPMILAFRRLLREKFVPFGFIKNTFISVQGTNIVIASYSGECPQCKKRNLHLIFNPLKNLINAECYYAKCENRPAHKDFSSRLIIDERNSN